MSSYVIPSLFLSASIMLVVKSLHGRFLALWYCILNNIYSRKLGCNYGGIFIASHRDRGILDVMHGNVVAVGSDGGLGDDVFILNPDFIKSGLVTILISRGRIYLLMGKW